MGTDPRGSVYYGSMRGRLGLLTAAAGATLAAALVVGAFRVGESDTEEAATPSRGVSAAESAADAPKSAVETCRSRSEARFQKTFEDSANLVVGPLVLVGGAEFTPASVVRRVGGQKYPLLIRAGHRVELVVPREARAFAGLGYGPLPQGEVTLKEAHEAVTFIACPADEPSFSGITETVGETTFWSGFVVTDAPHCVPLDVYVDDEPAPRRIVLELGVSPCPEPGGDV